MIQWVITSSLFILVIVILRYALKGKISLRLQYALWILVLIRLLVPVSFGNSRVSVMNLIDKYEVRHTANGIGTTGLVSNTDVQVPGSYYDKLEDNYKTTSTEVSLHAVDNEKLQESEKSLPKERIFQAKIAGSHLYALWLAGAAVVGVWLMVVNLGFALRVKRTRSAINISSCPMKVYSSHAVDTSCMFGLLRPAIYIANEDLKNEIVLNHVLEHELTHFRHLDHVWSFLRCICIAVHWYNPLVWWAASLSRQDEEMACDEATICKIGEGSRSSYGRTLIEVTCSKRRMGNLIIAATTMSGSKKRIKERIAMIAQRPRTTFYPLMAVLIISAMAVGCAFTGASKSAAKTTPEIQPIKTEETTPQATLEVKYGENGESSAYSEEKLYLINALYDIFNTGKEMSIDVQIGSGVTYKTYRLYDQSCAIKYGSIFSNYEYTKVAKPDTKPGSYEVHLASVDGTKSFTIFNGNTTTVMYNDGSNRMYWSAADKDNTNSFWGEHVMNPSLAELMYNEYLELCMSTDNVSFSLSGNASEAAELFVKRIYKEQCLDNEPPGKYSIKDYSALHWGVIEAGGDGKAIVGWMEYTLLPEYPDLHGFGAGNTVNGEGEYKGWPVMYRQFVLQKQADGFWHCVGFGTGGYSLPEHGAYIE